MNSGGTPDLEFAFRIALLAAVNEKVPHQNLREIRRHRANALPIEFFQPFAIAFGFSGSVSNEICDNSLSERYGTAATETFDFFRRIVRRKFEDAIVRISGAPDDVNSPHLEELFRCFQMSRRIVVAGGNYRIRHRFLGKPMEKLVIEFCGIRRGKRRIEDVPETRRSSTFSHLIVLRSHFKNFLCSSSRGRS